VAVAVAPLLAVTVRLTVYCPALAYWCRMRAPVPVVPSPKLQS
jgi:hypothetical protein